MQTNINHKEVYRVISKNLKSHKNKKEFYLDGNSAFNTVVELLNNHDAIPHLQEVSELSGVSLKTLYNWMNGKVKSPRICNVEAVVSCLGYELKLYMAIEKTH